MHTSMLDWFLTKVQEWFNWRNTGFSTNDGAGTTEYPHAKIKKKEFRYRLHSLHKKITQSESQT